MADTTPMMRQYLDLKSQHRDKILFFRLGDFYEMFREDAREASVLLNLTLTQRQNEPMCGVPYHSSGTYIRRLLEAGLAHPRRWRFHSAAGERGACEECARP